MNSSDCKIEEKSHDSKESQIMESEITISGKTIKAYDVLGQLSLEQITGYISQKQRELGKLKNEELAFLHGDIPQNTPEISKTKMQPPSPQRTNKNKNKNKSKNKGDTNTNTDTILTSPQNTNVEFNTPQPVNTRRTALENLRSRRQRKRPKRRERIKRLETLVQKQQQANTTQARLEAQQMLNEINNDNTIVTTPGITRSTIIVPGKPSPTQTTMHDANKQTKQGVHILTQQQLQPPSYPYPFQSQSGTHADIKLLNKFTNTLAQDPQLANIFKDIKGSTNASTENELLQIVENAKQQLSDALLNSIDITSINTRNRNLDHFERYGRSRVRYGDTFVPPNKRLKKSRSVGSNYSDFSNYSGYYESTRELSPITLSDANDIDKGNLFAAVEQRRLKKFGNKSGTLPIHTVPSRSGKHGADNGNVSGNKNKNKNGNRQPPPTQHNQHQDDDDINMNPSGNGDDNNNNNGNHNGGNGGNNGNENGLSGDDDDDDDDKTPTEQGSILGHLDDIINNESEEDEERERKHKQKLNFERAKLLQSKTLNKQIEMSGEKFTGDDYDEYTTRVKALKLFLQFDHYVKVECKNNKIDPVANKEIVLGELTSKLAGKAKKAYEREVSTHPNQKFDSVDKFLWWFAGEYDFNLMLPGLFSTLKTWKIAKDCPWDKIIRPYKQKYDLFKLAVEYTHRKVLDAMEFEIPGKEKSKAREAWNVRNLVLALKRHNERFKIYIKYLRDNKTRPETLHQLSQILKDIKQDQLSIKLLQYDDLDEIAGKRKSKNPPLGITKQANYAQKYYQEDNYNYDSRRGRSSSRGRGQYRGRGNSRGGRGRGGSQRGGGSRGRGRGRGGYRGGYRGKNRGRSTGYYNDRWSRRFNNNRNNYNDNNNQRGNYNNTRGKRGRGRGKSKFRGGFNGKRKDKCSVCGKFGHLTKDCRQSNALSKARKQVNHLSKKANKLEKQNKKLLKERKQDSKDVKAESKDSGSNPTVATIQQQRSKHNRSKRGKGGHRGRGRGRSKYRPSSYGRSAAPPHLETEAEYDRHEEYDEYGNPLASS